MARVSVRNVPEEDRIQIAFVYPTEPKAGQKRPRVFNFDRLKSEELEKTLERIKLNISTRMTKKRKCKKTEESVPSDPAEVAVQLVKEEMAVDGFVTNEEAWKEGTCLQVADQSYNVQLNIPAVKQISLPDCIMVGFLVYPKLILEFADEDKGVMVWFKANTKSLNANTKSLNAADNDLESDNDDEADANASGASVTDKTKKSHPRNTNTVSMWNEMHRGCMYTPVDEDLGCLFKVEYVPHDGKRDGDVTSCISKSNVSVGPQSCPFEKRQQYTRSLTAIDSFRCVSYNILADCYSDSDFARDSLFPYCPPHLLNIDYRKQLFIKELIGYNADVLCLQEVDKKIFEYDLKPVLGKYDFDGLLSLKCGEVAEGTATFYRQKKFRLLGRHDLTLKESILVDPLFEDILQRLEDSTALKEKLLSRTAVLQVSLLERVDDVKDEAKHLLVSTVHLYFHPKAPHVRTLQTVICVRHIERLLKQLYQTGIRPAVVFCGDLNAYPEAGVHEFLTKKRISAKHAEWYAGGKEEFVDGLELSHSLDLTSACGYPRYTNYVGGYCGCLDYIYVDNKLLERTNVVPMPSHEDVTEHSALPNIVFPSDHIAIICDLKWLKK